MRTSQSVCRSVPIVVCFACLTAAVVDAQAPAKIGSFESLDINADGMLSGTETKTVLAFDADGNGIVTKDEYAAGIKSMSGGSPDDDEKQFNRRDINEDGVLSGSEKSGLEKYDADGDGEVTKKEYMSGRAAERGSPKPEVDAQTRAVVEAAARQQADITFGGLDGNADGWLSGTEIVEAYKTFDTDGDGRITQEEFTAGFVKQAMADVNVDAVWKKTTVESIGLTFRMPGTPTVSKEDDATFYELVLDGGAVEYVISLSPIAAEFDDKPDALFKAIQDSAVGDGKLVDQGKSPVGDNPGVGIHYTQADGTQVWLVIVKVGRTLLQAAMTADAQTKIDEAEIDRFFDSLEIGNSNDKSPPPQADSPRIILTPPKMTNDPSAKSDASHTAFVDALAGGDAATMYAMLHPELQEMVDRPVFELYVKIIGEVMGAVKSKGLDGFQPQTVQKDGETVLTGENTVVYAEGPTKVSTKVADGKLIGFLIESPQLRNAVSAKMFADLSALGADADNFAKYYAPIGTEFVRTLFNDGAEEALDSLDPRVTAKLKADGEVAALTKIRADYGAVTKIELLTFSAEGDEDQKLKDFKIGLELTRPGKSVANFEAIFAIDGLHAVLMGYEFSEEAAAAADPPAPPAPAAPAAPPPPAEPTP